MSQPSIDRDKINGFIPEKNIEMKTLIADLLKVGSINSFLRLSSVLTNI